MQGFLMGGGGGGAGDKSVFARTKDVSLLGGGVQGMPCFRFATMQFPAL